MNKTILFTIAAFLYATVFSFGITVSPVDSTSIVTSLFSLIAAIFSLILQLLTYKKIDYPLKKLVLFFILGTISYVIAEIIWNYQIHFVALDALPIPGLHDIFYLLNTLFFIFAFFYLALTNKQNITRISFLLDLIIIYSTTVVILTTHFFVPLFLDIGYTFIEITVSTLYPALVILLLLSILTCISYIKVTLHFYSICLFFVALFMQIFGDTFFVINYYFSTYEFGSFLEPFWSLSIILYGVAIFSLFELKKGTNIKIVEPSNYNFNSNIARLIIQSVCILLLLYFFENSHYNTYKFMLIGVLVLVLIRQILAKYYINKLLLSISEIKKSLEVTVTERTEQLVEKNIELSKAINRINFLAYHDDLTGIPNRRALNDRLKIYSETEQPFTLIFVDINKFKEVNDTYGHSYGDEVLKAITQHLITIVGDQNNIFRLAGDEILILIDENGHNASNSIIENIKANSAIEIKVFNQCIPISFSIGIAHYPTDTDKVSEMINIADLSMYKSKKE